VLCIDFALFIPVYLFGIFASLLPGLHPNSIGALLNPWLSSWPDWPFMLVALLGIRIALQFLPSILVGTPAGETGLGMLPGARMMKEGRGLEALMICACAVVIATLAALALSPFLLPLFPSLFMIIKPWVGYLLVIASAVLICSEGEVKKAGYALLIFALAAALGLLTLNLTLLDPLFCLFVGFFTLPMLFSPHRLVKPRQKKTDSFPSVSLSLLPFIALGLCLGGLSDLLPGLSTPSQVAAIATLIVPLSAPAHYLALVASIEASHTAFAFSSAASAGVARVGVVAMAEQMTPISMQSLPVYLGTYALSVGIGAAALLILGRWLIPRWSKLDWPALSRLIGLYLILIILLNDGLLGLIVLACATLLGLLTLRLSVRRTHVMGALIGPAILNAFGLI